MALNDFTSAVGSLPNPLSAQFERYMNDYERVRLSEAGLTGWVDGEPTFNRTNTVYIDPTSGNDSNGGTSASDAVLTQAGLKTKLDALDNPGDAVVYVVRGSRWVVDVGSELDFTGDYAGLIFWPCDPADGSTKPNPVITSITEEPTTANWTNDANDVWYITGVSTEVGVVVHRFNELDPFAAMDTKAAMEAQDWSFWWDTATSRLYINLKSGVSPGNNYEFSYGFADNTSGADTFKVEGSESLGGCAVGPLQIFGKGRTIASADVDMYAARIIGSGVGVYYGTTGHYGGKHCLEHIRGGGNDGEILVAMTINCSAGCCFTGSAYGQYCATVNDLLEVYNRDNEIVGGDMATEGLLSDYSPPNIIHNVTSANKGVSLVFNRNWKILDLPPRSTHRGMQSALIPGPEWEPTNFSLTPETNLLDHRTFEFGTKDERSFSFDNNPVAGDAQHRGFYANSRFDASCLGKTSSVYVNCEFDKWQNELPTDATFVRSLLDPTGEASVKAVHCSFRLRGDYDMQSDSAPRHAYLVWALSHDVDKYRFKNCLFQWTEHGRVNSGDSCWLGGTALGTGVIESSAFYNIAKTTGTRIGYDSTTDPVILKAAESGPVTAASPLYRAGETLVGWDIFTQDVEYDIDGKRHLGGVPHIGTFRGV